MGSSKSRVDFACMSVGVTRGLVWIVCGGALRLSLPPIDHLLQTYSDIIDLEFMTIAPDLFDDCKNSLMNILISLSGVTAQNGGIRMNQQI